jgi:ABC-type transporter Mla MlaB component
MTPAMSKPSATQVKPKRSAALVLAADCRIAQCNDLQSALSRLLPRVAPVELDARAVQQIDTATLQLFAAFARERHSQGRSIVWRGAALPFTHAAECLGLAAVLGLEPA